MPRSTRPHTRLALAVAALAASLCGAAAHAQTELVIATVNNGHMIEMQKLSKNFEQANPDIKLKWVTLEEGVLRQRVTTDIATKGGWMLYSHFKDIPREILEAARMDGATLWQEVRLVLLPLGMGGLASTGLLCLVLSWNEAFWSLNLSAAKAGTLATLIASYSSPEGLFWSKLSAASLMAIAPIVVFGWFSQKQLVQGLTFGAVK